MAAAAVEVEEDLEAEEAEEVEVFMVGAAEATDMLVANQGKKMVLTSVVHAAGMIQRN